MKATRTLATFAALLVMGAAAPIQAQGFSFGIKAGLGATAGDVGDQRSRANVGLAAILHYSLSENKTLFGELRYRDLRAEYYEATKFGGGYTLNGTFAANGIQPVNTGSGATLRYGSVDTRRDTVEAVSLAFGYRAPLMSDRIHWQVGLSLDWAKSLQEVAGQLAVNTGNTATSTIEGLAATPSAKGIRPGAFVGLHMPITSEFFVEVNAVYFSFQQVNYLPTAYTGKAPATETKNVSKTVLEANFGLRF